MICICGVHINLYAFIKQAARKHSGADIMNFNYDCTIPYIQQFSKQAVNIEQLTF